MGVWLRALRQKLLQTNGTLITDRHVELFRTYNVGVGISVDGPGECNDARWMGTLERTRTATTTTLAAIDRLLAEGIRLSLIVTVHRCNASADRLPQMAVWFKELEKKGLKAARLHILESESAHIRERYGLSPAANLRAFRHFMALERGELTTLRFDVFAEMESLLLGEDESASCVWRACDPYTTRAVQGIEGTGQRSNCGRTNKDGIDFVKSRAEGFERYAALHETSYEDGGCSGCRFFLMCKGQCPGTALDGDWRNRTEHCAVWMGLFEDLERRLIAEGKEPLSRRADRAEIESRMVHAWVSGRNMTLKAVAAAPVDAR